MITGDVLPGGINDSVNLQITFGIIFFNLNVHIYKILDKRNHCSCEPRSHNWLLGHWSWLVILLTFLISAHLLQNGVGKEK